MNLWSQIQMTKVHFQMGALGRADYLDMLNTYYKRAIRLEALRVREGLR